VNAARRIRGEHCEATRITEKAVSWPCRMTAQNDILVWSILAALITPAQAEPVHLACYGKIRVTEFRGSHAEELPTQEGQSMSVIVDRSAGTVAVQEYGPVKLMGNLGDVWVFGGKPENETTQMSFDGYVNSVTDETVIVIHFGHFDQGGLRRFEGTCKPAKPAF
jgi:hypothetical protein